MRFKTGTLIAAAVYSAGGLVSEAEEVFADTDVRELAIATVLGPAESTELWDKICYLFTSGPWFAVLCGGAVCFAHQADIRVLARASRKKTLDSMRSDRSGARDVPVA